MMRSYSGPLKAVILDWAGTTVDHGSLAPVRVLQQVFAAHDVPISEAQARRDMGVLKKDHIRAILFEPSVSSKWRDVAGRAPTEANVETLFADFIPLQLECLATVLDRDRRRPSRSCTNPPTRHEDRKHHRLHARDARARAAARRRAGL